MVWMGELLCTGPPAKRLWKNNAKYDEINTDGHNWPSVPGQWDDVGKRSVLLEGPQVSLSSVPTP